MRTHYNHLAGRNVERLAALSDGIFGVGMTLLMLDLRVPAHELIQSERGLWCALAKLAPNLLTYFLSFLTLGIFWHGSEVELSHMKHGDRHFSWLQLGFLFFVTLVPFSTKLLSEYIEYRAALICYWANIFLLGVMLFTSWTYALRNGLVKESVSRGMIAAINYRIFLGQGLYALGALMCVFSTYLSIAFIVLVQLNFAFAPHYHPIKD